MTIRDGSAVLTGLLLAFVIPPGVSPLLPILAAVFAVYIGKHLLGGLGYNFFNPALLGAFFMATDYVTSPSNKKSQILFGIGIGALTVLIRLKGGYPEGICYAILLMNPLSTVFDGWFKQKRFAPPLPPPGGER